MGKPKTKRALKDNEAKAVLRMLRGSGQKLNLVAASIRGKKVEKALKALPEQDWSMERIAEVFTTLNATAVGDVAYGRALRIAVLGCEMGFEQSQMLAVVGRTESLSRIAAFIAEA